jgi:HK97 family phage major capsid protein
VSNFSEIKEAVVSTAEAFVEFKKVNERRLGEIKAGQDGLLDRIEELESHRLAPKNPGATAKGGDTFRTLRTKAGIELPYLSHEQKAGDYYQQRHSAENAAEDFDLGEYVRAAMLGSREGKLASGVMSVPTAVGSRIIDNVRALTAVVRAGAGTILIDGPTNLARVSGDATVYQHTEAATDITESDITLAAVTLNPKTLAALVPLTVELVQDSPNLDAVLRTALAGAFALKVDTLSIAKILADTAIPDSASAHDPATWAGTMLAITAALAANQDLPKSHISTPSNFMARASQLAATAGSWLGKPPALAAMTELFTSSMTTDVAVLGDFAAGFAIALRSELTLEVVRHAKATSAQHLLVAHMRADGVVLQPGRLYIQRKVP